jgi:hypothetical protein
LSFLLLLTSTPTKLEKREEQVLLGNDGDGGRRGWGQGREMVPTMYALMNT